MLRSLRPWRRDVHVLLLQTVGLDRFEAAHHVDWLGVKIVRAEGEEGSQSLCYPGFPDRPFLAMPQDTGFSTAVPISAGPDRSQANPDERIDLIQFFELQLQPLGDLGSPHDEERREEVDT